MYVYQEHPAERTLESLKGMLVRQARVRRDGRVVEIGVGSLTPGDQVPLLVKGAPDVLLARSARIMEMAGESALDAVARKTLARGWADRAKEGFQASRVGSVP